MTEEFEVLRNSLNMLVEDEDLTNERLLEASEGLLPNLAAYLNNLSKKGNADEWRSVRAGLPDMGERVLVMTDYGGYDVCYLNADNYWLNSMRPHHSNGSVTFWKRIHPPQTNKDYSNNTREETFSKEDMKNYAEWCRNGLLNSEYSHDKHDELLERWKKIKEQSI